MNDRQEDQISMMRTLLAIRTIFAALIGAITDLDSDFDDLEAEVSAIKLQLPKQKLQTKGVAHDKADVVADLVETATIVSGAVMAFASKAGNNTLFEEVKYSHSTLEHTRDEVLPDTCRIIHDKANDNLAALAGRGITALVLSNFMGLITELEGMSEAPRTATTQKGTATTTMAEHFKEGMKIVKERLDGGMKIFILTNPELYKTYKNGRKIVNTGRRKQDLNEGKLEFHVVDGASNGLNGVVVSFDNRVGSTDDAGDGVVKGVPVGNKLVRFFKPGYGEVFLPVAIVKGQVSTLNVTLVAVGTGGLHGTVQIGGAFVPATVTVEGTTLSTTTDAFGNYNFMSVPAGSQNVRAVETANPARGTTLSTTILPAASVALNFMVP